MIKSNKEGVISMIYRLEEIKNDILQDYKRV